MAEHRSSQRNNIEPRKVNIKEPGKSRYIG